MIASAAVMELLGLSTALGAFIAGVMLADSPYRHELEADVEPFRSILLGLFFLAVGMMLDLHAIAERPFFVIGMALALIAIKAGDRSWASRMLFRMAWRPALALGLLLSQGGEFGFVLFAQAQSAMLIDARGGEPVRRDRHAVDGDDAVPDDGDAASIRADAGRDGTSATARRPTAPTRSIVGYGRFGQTVAQMLIAQGIPVTLIDTDIEMIDVAGSFGAKVYYGDGTRLDLLRQAGAADAELILFCIDGDQIERRIARGRARGLSRRRRSSCAPIDRRALLKLRGAPVAGRRPRGARIRRCKMARHGAGERRRRRARRSTAPRTLYRARDRERLKAQFETGDIRAQLDRIIVTPEQALVPTLTRRRGKPGRCRGVRTKAAPFLSCAIRAARRAGSTSVTVGRPTAFQMRDRPLGVRRRAQAALDREAQAPAPCRSRPPRHGACRSPPRARGRRCGRD